MQALSSTRSIATASFAAKGRAQARGSRTLRLVAQSSASHLSAFQENRALKVIAGLNNFDATSVASVVKAADLGGATHIDIACDSELVKLAKSLTELPIFVSSVVPADFVAAVEAGADMIEIGNFDCFYKDGREFSAEEVLALTRETRALLPGVPMSVTVPHTLELSEQVELALALEAAGADMIQTEGGTSSAPVTAGVQGLIEKATPTLAAAHAISAAVTIPVMCASGISHVTAPMAIAAGAAGVGVGSAVNKLTDQLSMIATVRTLAESVNTAARIPSSAPQ